MALDKIMTYNCGAIRGWEDFLKFSGTIVKGERKKTFNILPMWV